MTHIDATLLSTNVNMRGVLLDMLSFLPQEKWLSFDDVIDWILTVFPNSVSHQYSRGLIFTSVADGWRNWLQLVLQSILTGPLHNLGLVDVAPSLNYVEVFRLHHFQDVHWRRVTHLDIEIGETMGDRAIHLEAESKTLKVTMPIHPDFLFVIQQWSKIGSIKGKTLVFHLDVDSLHQTFEQGITLIDICDAWEKHTGVKPPDYLLTWWNRWWHNYGQVRLYSPEAILMTRDSFTMKEVQLAVPRLSVSLQEMITPTTAVIKSENVDQVVEDLERQGYMPKKVG